MNIPRDKFMHAGVGTAVSLLAMLVWSIASLAGLTHLTDAPAAGALAGLVSGVTKEGCDWLDNNLINAMHGVEPWDAIATALPGAFILAAWRAWLHFGAST